MSEKNIFYMKCFSTSEAVKKIQHFFKRHKNNKHIFYLESTFSKASEQLVVCSMTSGIILIYHTGV